jgi:hypothetical protein
MKCATYKHGGTFCLCYRISRSIYSILCRHTMELYCKIQYVCYHRRSFVESMTRVLSCCGSVTLTEDLCSLSEPAIW